MWYRAFRAVENVKEWSMITFPAIWALSLFGKQVPVIGEFEAIATVGVSLLYCYFSYGYYFGYKESVEGRQYYFWKRYRLCSGLLLADFAAVGYAIYAVLNAKGFLQF